MDPKIEERTTPGSRVRIFGVLKEVPVPLQTGAISTRFDIAIEANNTIPLEETFADLKITEEDERQILELSTNPNAFNRLSQSIAPSVYGFEKIKEALLLQLFSGVKKKKSDGGFTRGNIHILLVGDPGVAKSVTLKFMSRIAPKGRYVSGKATTGAGLTAAVVKDEFLKGWSLEAGAMVLANKGMVCIDEIEKMDEHDRSTMHEAMEQQCYHHDTRITLADGSEVKIGELVEKLLIENQDKIVEGKDCFILPVNNIEVLTTDFTKIYKTKAARVSKHKAFDKFIKIKLSHGREIIVTPEHPVFTVENGKIITKRADEIKIGDPAPIALALPIAGQQQPLKKINSNLRSKQHIKKSLSSRGTFGCKRNRKISRHRELQKQAILLCSRTPCPEGQGFNVRDIKIPENNGPLLYKIVGYYVSEGSREKNRGKIIGINFTNKDARLLDDFEQAMKEEFGLSPYKQIRIDKNGPCGCYRYTSAELTEFIKINMPELLHTSTDKQIPQLLMKGRREDLAILLSSLFEGDGYVAVKKRTIRIGYKTKSKLLAHQIQDILLRFRIRSSVTENRGYYRVGITEYTNLQRFFSSIGFITQEKNEIISSYLKEKSIKRHVKNRLPLEFNDKIINIIEEEEIKQVGKYKKYDIIYDHMIRKDKFTFSTHFIRELIKSVRKEKNKTYLQQFLNDIGWEYVSGIELIPNEEEKWVYDVTIEPRHAFISQAAVLHNTVTISKANIQATLRAETSVLAAGNPKLGRFDPFTPIPQQIDISPALLSRFDVIFVIRDIPNKHQDEAIATHVLQEHKQEVIRDVVEPALLRKYVAYAQRLSPKLTDEAVSEIKNFYVHLRNQSVSTEKNIKPIPITARQLEAIIRLSEACARIRLSDTVKASDAQRAIDLLKYSLMQVGYDEETKTFDIDRIQTGITANTRNKIMIVRDALARLESKVGQLIPVEELKKEIGDKLAHIEVEE
ncbi:MAG: LAGLIDADG family homing endonuclease, partial [Nanoarchaeota archaeon]